MKKRLFALLLSAVMLLSLTVPAMAEDVPPEGYSAEGTTATVTTFDALKYALSLDFGTVERVRITADMNIPENLTINRTVEASADLTVDCGANLTVDDGADLNISGTLLSIGRLENRGCITVEENGTLELPDSDSAITYDTAENSGWEALEDHVMFNRNYLRVEDGGTVNVGSALQNDWDACIDLCGTMNVFASAAGDNMSEGVINGSVKCIGYFNINSGTLNIEAAYDAHTDDKGTDDPNDDEEIPAHPYAAVFVAIRDFNINDGGGVNMNGAFYNYGDLNIGNGCTLEVSGTLNNDNSVRNYGNFIVYDSTRIYNHGHLYVGDSKTFGSDNETEDYGCLGHYDNYSSIDWSRTSVEKETILSDDYTYRIWEVRGPQYRQLNESFYKLKCTDNWGMIVMVGQDYYGGWRNAADKVSDEGDTLQSFRVVSSNSDIITVGEADGDYDTFTLSYRDWGDTSLHIMAQESGEEERCVRTYDAGVCLNYAGFYTDRCLTDDGQYIDETTAQNNAAILGGGYVFNAGDQLWLMRKDEGFDLNVLDVNDDYYEINIWYGDNSGGGNANISEPDDDGWYTVSMTEGENEVEYLKFRPEARSGNSEKFDIHFEILGERNYDIDGRIYGVNFSLFCYKPTVYVEDVPAVKGHDVTVAVRAENFNNMNVAGYQFKLRYDPDKLTPIETEPVTSAYSGAFSCDTSVSGEITVAFTGDTNITYLQDGELFRMTFHVQDTDAVGACDDIEIYFDDQDDQFEQGVHTIVGSSERELSTSLRSGCVQTFIPGDVHRDGKINTMDAIRLLRYCVNDIELSDVEYQAALIVAGQAEPNVAGVVQILNRIVKSQELSYYGSL